MRGLAGGPHAPCEHLRLHGQSAAAELGLLVGHKGSHMTELVYRTQLRPVVEEGSTVMDDLFRRREE